MIEFPDFHSHPLLIGKPSANLKMSTLFCAQRAVRTYMGFVTYSSGV